MNSSNICLNCHRDGHRYRHCSLPIRSFGIIAYQYTKAGLKFLLVQRKDSYSYTDFLRGKYCKKGVMNWELLDKMLSEMTNEELHRIKNMEFDDLWEDLWVEKKGIYFNERARSRKIFSLFDTSFVVKSVYTETEFGFPKGRKTLEETPLNCALREFSEETCIDKDSFELSADPCINEVFTGSDGVEYSHSYYLAKLNDTFTLNEKVTDLEMLKEIKSIGLFEYTECISKFRDYDHSKKAVLSEIYERLTGSYFV